MRKVVPELIPLINDEAEDIALKALTILCSIARKDQKKYLDQGIEQGMGLICEKKVVEELLKTLRMQKKNKKIVSSALRTLFSISCNEATGRNLFLQTLTAHGTDCLQDLVHCIGIQEYSCFKYAFLTLHNLMTDAHIGQMVIAYMCEMRVLTKVLDWLDDKNEKFLNLVTDIVDKLVSRNSEQMAFLLGLNGHQKLIQVLANCRQETLLMRTVNLLCRIVPKMDPAKMVAAGLLEAAQKHLDHASQRLLRQLLKCIRDVSYVPCTGHDIQLLLQKMLQLLGTNDLRLKEECTDILANLCANNAQNKEFLVGNGAIPELFHLLHELAALQHELGPSPQRDGIQETALSLLKSLSSGNARAATAKQQLLSNDCYKRLLLDKLSELRSLPLLSRTLILLQQLAQEERDLPLLRFFLPANAPHTSCTSSDSEFPQLPDAPLAEKRCGAGQCFSFVSQIVFLLHRAMASLPETIEICQRCLDILKAMARDGRLLEEIFVQLMAGRIRWRENHGSLLAPQLLASHFDQLAPNCIALIAELARIQKAAERLQRDQATMDCLQRWSESETRTAQLSKRALQLIAAGTRGTQQQGNNRERVVDEGQPGSKFLVHGKVHEQQKHALQYSSKASADTQLESREGEELSSLCLNNSPATAATRMEFSPMQIDQCQFSPDTDNSHLSVMNNALDSKNDQCHNNSISGNGANNVTQCEPKASQAMATTGEEQLILLAGTNVDMQMMEDFSRHHVTTHDFPAAYAGNNYYRPHPFGDFVGDNMFYPPSDLPSSAITQPSNIIGSSSTFAPLHSHSSHRNFHNFQ